MRFRAKLFGLLVCALIVLAGGLPSWAQTQSFDERFPAREDRAVIGLPGSGHADDEEDDDESNDEETDCPTYPMPLAQTGVDYCVSEEGLLIDCAGTGQDADLRMGVPLPDPRFTTNGDGTATDTLTGLIWVIQAPCFGGRWHGALELASEVSDGRCGLTDGSEPGDWRMPNLIELRSLIAYDQPGPVPLPPGHPFQVLGHDFWTSTIYAPGGGGSAWSIDFYLGDLRPKLMWMHYLGLWPVRGPE